MANKEKLKQKRVVVRKKKNIKPIIFSFVVILIASAVLLYSGIIKSNNTDIKIIGADLSKKKVVSVYPRQYSDLHITDNAKTTNPKYMSLTFGNHSSLLGNAISSLKTTPGSQLDQIENGSWLWTPILQITPDYRDKIISDSKKRGIKNLYLSIDSYLDIYIMPDGEEKNSKDKLFDSILTDFIQKANENGITIDAEAGWRNWAELGNSYKAFVTLNYAIEFNKRHEAKFRGFQYDIEPYLLDYYSEDSKEVLGNFINLIDESVAKLDDSDLRLSVVIPEFYDGTYDNTPQVFYAGQTLYPFEQILRVLDKREGSTILIMAYRNFTDGPNGSIDISKDEVTTANKYKTKIILALETGKVDPAYITFYNKSRTYFNKEKSALEKAFQNNPSYGGVATHYINSLLEIN